MKKTGVSSQGSGVSKKRGMIRAKDPEKTVKVGYEEWKMPEWMEPYRELICNTGGNPIEELMNDHHTNTRNNVVRIGLIVSVDSQIILLRRLRQKGFLKEEAPK